MKVLSRLEIISIFFAFFVATLGQRLLPGTARAGIQTHHPPTLSPPICHGMPTSNPLVFEITRFLL